MRLEHKKLLLKISTRNYFSEISTLGVLKSCRMVVLCDLNWPVWAVLAGYYSEWCWRGRQQFLPESLLSAGCEGEQTPLVWLQKPDLSPAVQDLSLDHPRHGYTTPDLPLLLHLQVRGLSGGPTELKSPPAPPTWPGGGPGDPGWSPWQCNPHAAWAGYGGGLPRERRVVHHWTEPGNGQRGEEVWRLYIFWDWVQLYNLAILSLD